MPDISETMELLEAGLALVLAPLAEGAEPRVRLNEVTLEDGETVEALELSLDVMLGNKVGFSVEQILGVDVPAPSFVAQLMAHQLVQLAHELMTRAELLSQATPELIEEQLTQLQEGA